MRTFVHYNCCCCDPLTTGDDLQTQVIINFNALVWLLSLLGSQKKGIRKEACWTISNITAGNKDQIQAVIDANIIPPLIGLLSNAEFDIRKEAAWAISNATRYYTVLLILLVHMSVYVLTMVVPLVPVLLLLCRVHCLQYH
jgi:Armadillo/beta-catenin-like repeat